MVVRPRIWRGSRDQDHSSNGSGTQKIGSNQQLGKKDHSDGGLYAAGACLGSSVSQLQSSTDEHRSAKICHLKYISVKEP